MAANQLNEMKIRNRQELYQFAGSRRCWKINYVHNAETACRTVETPCGRFLLHAWPAAPADRHKGRWCATARRDGDLVAEWYATRDEVVTEIIGAENALLALREIKACGTNIHGAREIAIQLRHRQIDFLAMALDQGDVIARARVLEAIIFRLTGERIHVDQWRLRSY